MALNIAIVGNDHESDHPVFFEIPKSLEKAAVSLDLSICTHWISTSDLESSVKFLDKMHGIFAAPSPFENLSGFYRSVQFAREGKIPWLGACGGTQYALIEFASHVLNLKNPSHVEADPQAPLKFVNFLPDEFRVPNDGPLKEFEIFLKLGSLGRRLYGCERAVESFFANFTLDPLWYEAVEKSGLKISAWFHDKKTPCLFELENHPFFVGALFQPQISTDRKWHPLINAFIQASSK